MPEKVKQEKYSRTDWIITSVSVVLLLFFALLNGVDLPTWFPSGVIKYKYKLLGALVTFHFVYWTSRGLLFSKERYFARHIRPGHSISDRMAIPILIVIACLVLAWFGLVVFNNPYMYGYNHGNGAYYAQLLSNITRGLGPEHTVKFNGALYFFGNPYFYASAFSVVPHILPLLLLSPLYALFPYPPMHVYAMMIVVIFAGSLGMYLAIRTLGGSAMTSLLGAVGYCIIPWTELPLFQMGAFDNLGLAIYPYVFASLFARKWILFYISLILLALIDMPYTYSVIALGATVAVFFKYRMQGLIAMAIGVTLMLWDISIIRESLCGIWNMKTQASSSLLQIFREYDFSALKGAFLFHGMYLFMLFMTVAFLPLAGIRREGKWNRPVIGLLFFALVGAVMGLYRSYDWTSHRNSNMIVPVYLSVFMTYLGAFASNVKGGGKAESQRMHMLIGVLLISSITAMTIWFSWYCPWAPLTGRGSSSPMVLVRPSTINSSYESVLSKMKQFIPEGASVAYRVDAGIQAFITNRQKAWNLGFHPEGVEYYFIQTKEIVYIDENLPPWRPFYEQVLRDKDLRILYRDERISIFKNLRSKPIPRLEAVLGWDVLFKAIWPGTCKPQGQDLEARSKG